MVALLHYCKTRPRTRAILAEVGHQVVCVDVDAEKIEKLKQGIIPIFELGLESLVKENTASGRLRFTTDAAMAVAHGDIQFIAVGTPPDEDGSADLQYVLRVSQTIAEHMPGHRILVNKSTVPVGTADRVRARVAERLGADIEAVRQGIGSDPRIGYRFIYPGVGYGGSCFPKDVQALVRTAEGIDFDAKVLKAVEARNADQKTTLCAKIRDHFGVELAGKTIAVWGLSFKPNTDDMREAPSRVLMEALWNAGAKVQAYDPEAMEETQRLYGHHDALTLCGTKEGALKGADALVVVTEWQSFRAPDFELIKGQLTQPTIFDGRNMFEPARMAKKGFTYYSVGRLPQAPTRV
ncbi:MAG: UDP-glucose/GDP-mannose dehydrogenase family protein [Halomonas sp.]|uniref:UDP-glucose dehydrogenase family protein n=1 Tax=Halomonas sp. TaxID=1486246 RepID=UPI002ACD93EF|nr:UDP-glucose/GDP-mannose dehydrogenase family protein [Halomonas sp.]MDZ7851990.1 UDP-glucose/GDP-mannose dehydrogenase family protein [Halomonas sp.]